MILFFEVVFEDDFRTLLRCILEALGLQKHGFRLRGVSKSAKVASLKQVAFRTPFCLPFYLLLATFAMPNGTF